ncbi:MAG: hypothetical protein HQ579_09545, partial [Candidatus Omnitrophica bacterium]|nr:hypothetical protein [Candidatus Omnitrophota bacterium]
MKQRGDKWQIGPSAGGRMRRGGAAGGTINTDYLRAACEALANHRLNEELREDRPEVMVLAGTVLNTFFRAHKRHLRGESLTHRELKEFESGIGRMLSRDLKSQEIEKAMQALHNIGLLGEQDPICAWSYRMMEAAREGKKLPAEPLVIAQSRDEHGRHEDAAAKPSTLLYKRIVEILRRGLKEHLAGRITADSLASASEAFRELEMGRRNEITREIARVAIEAEKKDKHERVGFGNERSLPQVKVGGVTVSGPADVTLIWRTAADDSLKLIDVKFDAGGGSINTAKAIANQGEKFGLVALEGTGPISNAYRAEFASKHIVASLARMPNDTKTNVLNIVDGQPLPSIGGRLLVGWGEEISRDIMKSLLTKVD